MQRLAIQLLFFCLLPTWVGANVGYYRFPAIHGEILVFTAEGDLWKVSVHGGDAQRLTSHAGIESNAAISPDGKLLAFSAEYHGATEVYTMPLLGGLPTRRSFDGDNAQVRGWSQDRRILYSSRYYSDLPNWQLHLIELEANRRTPIPLHQADSGSYDPRSGTLYFTRLPFQGSHTKRYRGGTAQNIWKFAPNDDEAQPITANYPGTSKAPMWWQGRVYFASDRNGTMNIWSMDTNGGDLKQHTFHSDWDVRSPSLHENNIVYQLGADIYLLDTTANETNKVEIRLTSDFDQRRTRWLDKPMDYLTSVHISPDGDKIALTARGRVYVAPIQKGRFVEVDRQQGVRFRDARFFADNDTLLLLNDASGEQEFWQYPANGVGIGERLTSNADSLRFDGIASPNGRYFGFVDREGRLWLHDVQTKQTSEIDKTNYFDISGLSWSPDSQWLAYDIQADNMMRQLRLRHVATGRTVNATSERVDSYTPAWSPDGHWLYFLSDRNLESVVGSPWGPRQPEPFFDKPTEIYALALQDGVRFPFLDNNELVIKPRADDDKVDEGSSGQGSGSDNVAVDIQEGFETRLYKVPLQAGKYSDLAVSNKRLFYLHEPVAINSQKVLMAVAIGNEKIAPVAILPGVVAFEKAAQSEKLLLRTEQDLLVVDANIEKVEKLDDIKVKLDEWRIFSDPVAEWRQMLRDAWRLERDYFYDPEMHGADWDAVLARHLLLVERVTSREELNDLMEQMVGELEALHIFVRGGDLRLAKDIVDPAGLGVNWQRDESAGGYRIDKIYQGDGDYIDLQSPLSRPEVGVMTGDVILAINGVSTLTVSHPNILLDNQAGKQIRLLVKAGDGNVFDAITTPLKKQDEASLRYVDWEQSRRKWVESASDNRIGYVHLQAMGGRNYTQWVREFYPVFNRQGLIIDMRHNRGGNIDSWILARLLRQAWFYWKGRDGAPYANMQYAFNGHLVVIVNEFTASDGEAFAEGFRRLGLGRVLGTRTWGGEIWLSMSNRLADNGIASAAEIGVYGPEGEWLIEGHGVDPDVEVDNLPHATFNGEDAQLDAAIVHLKERIAQEPREIPTPPPFPNMPQRRQGR